MELVHLHPVDFQLGSAQSLVSLSSLELALVQFHPDQTSSLTAEARKLWHRRRKAASPQELDAYSSLPQLTPRRVAPSTFAPSISGPSFSAQQQQQHEHQSYISSASTIPQRARGRPSPFYELICVLESQAQRGSFTPLARDVAVEWCAMVGGDWQDFLILIDQAAADGVIRKGTEYGTGEWLELNPQGAPPPQLVPMPAPPPPTPVLGAANFHLADLDFAIPPDLFTLDSTQLLCLQFHADFNLTAIRHGISARDEVEDIWMKRKSRDSRRGMRWGDAAQKPLEGGWDPSHRTLQEPAQEGWHLGGNAAAGSKIPRLNFALHTPPYSPEQRSPTNRRPQRPFEGQGVPTRRRSERSRSPPPRRRHSRSAFGGPPAEQAISNPMETLDRRPAPPPRASSCSTLDARQPNLGPPPLQWRTEYSPLSYSTPQQSKPSKPRFSNQDPVPVEFASTFTLLHVTGIPFYVRSAVQLTKDIPDELRPDGVYKEEPKEPQRSGLREMWLVYSESDRAKDAYRYINEELVIPDFRGPAWKLSAEREFDTLPLLFGDLCPDVRFSVREELKRRYQSASGEGWGGGGSRSGGRGVASSSGGGGWGWGDERASKRHSLPPGSQSRTSSFTTPSTSRHFSNSNSRRRHHQSSPSTDDLEIYAPSPNPRHREDRSEREDFGLDVVVSPLVLPKAVGSAEVEVEKGAGQVAEEEEDGGSEIILVSVEEHKAQEEVSSR